jgi:hypothetical protein
MRVVGWLAFFTLDRGGDAQALLAATLRGGVTGCGNVCDVAGDNAITLAVTLAFVTFDFISCTFDSPVLGGVTSAATMTEGTIALSCC